MSEGVANVDDVFINCPFDDDYASFFDAIVFAIFACQFRPRSALEVEDGSQVRIEKIYGIIEGCRFGVHDLSRTELDPVSALPRFNTPLELGIFLGAKRFGGDLQRAKRCLIFDRERYRYQKFISDIAGQDIQSHDDDPVRALRLTRDWLANVSGRTLPGATDLARLYRSFVFDREEAYRKLGFGSHRPPYIDRERVVTEWLLNFQAPESAGASKRARKKRK